MLQHAQGVDWLPPRGGRRAQYRVLERVLQSASPWQHEGDRPALDRSDIPPSALVVALSSLASDEILMSLAALRTHGREVAVLAIDARDATVRLTDLDQASARLAHLVFDARVTYLRRLSTPVVVWDPRDDIDRSLATLDRLIRRQMAVRAAS
jgi:hypothetical protein